MRTWSVPPSNRAEPPLQEGGNPFHRSYLIELKKNPLSVKDTTYSVDLKDRTLLISKLEIIGPPYTNIWSLCTSKYIVFLKNSLLNFTSAG